MMAKTVQVSVKPELQSTAVRLLREAGLEIQYIAGKTIVLTSGTNTQIDAALAGLAKIAKQDTADEKVTDRLDHIKAECRRRIYLVASPEAQMNLSALTGVVSGKPPEDRTDQQNSILAGAEMAIGWVNAMKGRIDYLMKNSEVDFKADKSWPDCPQPVVGLLRIL